ncbi:MAG: hypothetical protein OEV08_14825 [Nitrospira sp.]|nr:hypothetical protein [Nitrospira sp.]
MRRPRPLNHRQEKYLEAVAGGAGTIEAAMVAGYTRSYALVAGRRLSKHPLVRAAIDSIKTDGRTVAAYTLAVAMEEAQRVIEFAKQHKNPMAYFKAVELRARLSGLLIERVHVEKVDLSAALAEARARVLDLPAIESHDSGSADKSDIPEPRGRA